ncbi:galactose mutarotase [Photobacterium sagamiensis]|uniref:aldose epimerase family protein n=1 Tax=Photobacterium sagamiensis TaxID=2910241 RepID=UPI003D0C7E1E
MKLYRLENNGVKVDISPIGASIINFFVRDKDNVERNIVLGYDTEDRYKNNSTYFGAVVGPIANRVDLGEFTLRGTIHKLTQNDGTNHLHGGDANLNSRNWSILDYTEKTILLRARTEKGEGGYPSGTQTTVMYHLDDKGSLKISYVSTPDTVCPLNITQHTYFNLDGAGDVLDHEMWIDSDMFLPVDESLIPNGVTYVEDSPFDFRAPRKISEALSSHVDHRQLLVANGGYDHCYVLNHRDLTIESMRVRSEKTGITLSVKTDLPGVQFYSGNFLDNEQGRGDEVYNKHAGLCLETQFFPNLINSEHKEQCIFTLTHSFISTTIYSVSID